MDLVKAALDAAIAADKEAAAARALQIAQHRLEQHRALEREAERWGIGPIPIEELRCFHDEPGTGSYYWWPYEINEHFVLIVRVTSVNGTKMTETRVLTKQELDRTQGKSESHDRRGASPDNGMQVTSLALIGRRIRNHPSYKED